MYLWNYTSVSPSIAKYTYGGKRDFYKSFIIYDPGLYNDHKVHNSKQNLACKATINKTIILQINVCQVVVNQLIPCKFVYNIMTMANCYTPKVCLKTIHVECIH